MSPPRFGQESSELFVEPLRCVLIGPVAHLFLGALRHGGNNAGKATSLRAIHGCFHGKADAIIAGFYEQCQGVRRPVDPKNWPLVLSGSAKQCVGASNIRIHSGDNDGQVRRFGDH